MTESLKKSIFKGTLILTLAGIGARILGFYNRIFLNQLIGERELGLYQILLPIYMIMFSFACQGIQTSLTRQVARASFHSQKQALLCLALSICIPTSVLLAVCNYICSDWISLHLLHSGECAGLLRILSFAFPFVCIEGCMVGYFMGESHSGVTAVSQIVEQIAKISGVFLLAKFYIHGRPQADLAVYGIVFGEITASGYLVIYYLLHSKKTTTQKLQQSDTAVLLKNLLQDGIPLTANRLSLTMLQGLENIIIPHMLNLYYHNGDTALILYGTLSGLVLPCIMFPTTLTGSLAMTLLPAISTQYERQNIPALTRIIKKSLITCLAIGLCSSIYLLLLGKWTGRIILSSEASGELLFQFAPLCPFIYLSSSLANIMNGIGKATSNTIFTILCSGIRISFILLFVPHIGLQGYMWGMLASYLIQTVVTSILIYHSVSTADDDPVSYSESS